MNKGDDMYYTKKRRIKKGPIIVLVVIVLIIILVIVGINLYKHYNAIQGEFQQKDVLKIGVI